MVYSVVAAKNYGRKINKASRKDAKYKQDAKKNFATWLLGVFARNKNYWLLLRKTMKERC
jgi:hypothetical protein